MDRKNTLLAVPSDFEEKLAIMHMIDRPLCDLRVTDFCASSGVSRKRFYRLFKSKFDIVFWYYDVCNRMTLYEIGRTLTWGEAFTRQLILLDEEHDFLARESASALADGRFAENRLRSFNKRKDILIETLEVYRGITVTHEIVMEVSIYAEMESVLMTQWLLGTSNLSLKEFVVMWEDCVPRQLHDALLG